jgi:hypothetical protein
MQARAEYEVAAAAAVGHEDVGVRNADLEDEPTLDASGSAATPSSHVDDPLVQAKMEKRAALVVVQRCDCGRRFADQHPRPDVACKQRRGAARKGPRARRFRQQDGHRRAAGCVAELRLLI